jgi:hypothetical protein
MAKLGPDSKLPIQSGKSRLAHALATGTAISQFIVEIAKIRVWKRVRSDNGDSDMAILKLKI